MFLISGLLFLIFMIVNMSDRKRIRRSYCPHCGEKYDYEEDVSWECTNVVTGDREQTAELEICCSCDNCGEETVFTKSFKTASVDSQGRIKEYNLQNEVRKYFVK